MTRLHNSLPRPGSMLPRRTPASRRIISSLLLCIAAVFATALNAATINVWYGDYQVFGQLGVPQKWVNVLGNVTDHTTVSSLSYSLNGAAPKPLKMGPDTRRLQNPGDFNADIPIDDLADGTNTVVITAVAGGTTITKTVTVEFHRNRIWPAPYAVNWATVSRLQDAVQVVDGRWTFSAAGARTAAWGYDRVLAIGDVLWNDYEITVPVTIHAVDTSSTAYNSVSIGPGLGIILRWYGHEDWGTRLKGPWQPVIGWEPFGGNIWYDWSGSGLLSISGEDGMYQADPQNRKLAAGNTYFFKMRVESSTNGGGGIYRAKLWLAGQTEPSAWQMTGQEGSSDLPGGSLLLVAHHVDATFGNFSIVPLSDGTGSDTTPPVIANVQNTVGTTTAAISWVTDEPTYGAVTVSGGYREEFNGTALDNSTWSWVNPAGDGSYSVSEGRVSLSVPAGTTHDIGVGTYTTPRIMRSMANKDLEFTVKIDSTVAQSYQRQGLVIEQDAGRLVRVETYRDGSYTKLYAATVNDGRMTARLNIKVGTTAPFFLRVGRAGNRWTISHSYDGASWTTDQSFTLPMTVKAAGLYVGNSGGPAHTAVFDWASSSATNDISSGGPTTQHSASLTSLVPGTTYQYWVSATDVAGNSAVSPEYQFTTQSDNTPPASYTLSAATSGSGTVTASPNQTTYQAGTVVQLSATAASGWTFSGWSGDLTGTSNPASLTMDANKAVTATFTATPAPEKKTVTITVAGNGTVSRQPDQSQYDVGQVVQLLATPASGWTFAGWSGDLSGTTNPVSLTVSTNHNITATFAAIGDTTPPAITNLQAAPGATSASVSWTTSEPATGVVSYDFSLLEEFNGTALNTSAWTFTNPLGDATQSVSGGRLYLSVPAGSEHDVWTGNYSVPRVMRPVPNKDFTLQVKFDSAVTQRYQQQGLLVEQDANNLVRAEVYHDGASVKLFAATIASGTATARITKQVTIGSPVYLRLARAGNQWTLSYSSNGTSWTTGGSFTLALNVVAAGVHVGNYTAAHTAVVDSLTGSWAPDTVSVGTGTQHNASLTALKAAANYRYRVTATDAAGNSATSADAQFATTAGP